MRRATKSVREAALGCLMMAGIDGARLWLRCKVAHRRFQVLCSLDFQNLQLWFSRFAASISQAAWTGSRFGDYYTMLVSSGYLTDLVLILRAPLPRRQLDCSATWLSWFDIFLFVCVATPHFRSAIPALVALTLHRSWSQSMRLAFAIQNQLAPAHGLRVPVRLLKYCGAQNFFIFVSFSISQIDLWFSTQISWLTKPNSKIGHH